MSSAVAKKRAALTAAPDPLLKWSGGKRELPEKHPSLFPKPEDIVSAGGTYREPFLGGAAVASRYLYWADCCNHCNPKPEDVKAGTVPACVGCHEGVVRVQCALSDAEAPLIAMYRGVRDAPQEVINRLQELADRYSETTYYDTRSLFNMGLAGEIETTDPEWAARLIFLNRTGFNGGYRMNKKGQYNIPFGNPKGTYRKPLICDEANIWAWSAMLARPSSGGSVSLLCDDYADRIAGVKRGDFIFLDPPYVPRDGNKRSDSKRASGFTRYTKDGFDLKDQERLAEMLPDIDLAGAKFMLTNHVEAAYLYEGWDITEIQVGRPGNSDGKGRGSVTEIVVRNY